MWFVPQMRNAYALPHVLSSPAGRSGKAPGSPWSPFVSTCALGEVGEHRATPGPSDNLQVSLLLLWAANILFPEKKQKTTNPEGLKYLFATPFLPSWCHLVTA